VGAHQTGGPGLKTEGDGDPRDVARLALGDPVASCATQSSTRVPSRVTVPLLDLQCLHPFAIARLALGDTVAEGLGVSCAAMSSTRVSSRGAIPLLNLQCLPPLLSDMHENIMSLTLLLARLGLEVMTWTGSDCTAVSPAPPAFVPCILLLQNLRLRSKRLPAIPGLLLACPWCMRPLAEQ